MRKLVFLVLIFCQVACLNVMASSYQDFTVKKIKINGLQKVSVEAVLQKISVKKGDVVSQEEVSDLIQTIFKTGFFKDVKVFKDNNDLIIDVIERPSIGSLNLTGVKKKDKVEEILKNNEIIEGRIFNPINLDKMQDELEIHYLTKGRYGVKINTDVNEEERNRVSVNIEIYEGVESRVKRINIVGNNAFSDEEIKKKMLHKKTNFLSWYKKDDRYAKEKLDADLEIIRSYYLDRGYINFVIDSSQVSITPDKKDVYLTINISEGKLHTLGEVTSSGNFIISKERIDEILEENLKPGDIFSRTKFIKVKNIIEQELGKEGYSNAEVRPNYKLAEGKDNIINVDFYVEPNNRVMVRRVNYIGNSLTKDSVLRRGAPQMESTWISTEDVKKGKDYILRKGYSTKVDVDTVPVVGDENKVDINYNIEEQRTMSLSAGIAYSASDKLQYNLGANFRNFVGTGKDLNFAFNQSKTVTSYSFGYFDPYFTDDGIGMGFDTYYTKTNLSKNLAVFDYSNDAIGASVNFNVPITEYDDVFLALGYDDRKIKFDDIVTRKVNGVDTQVLNPPTEIYEFTQKEGKSYKEYSATIGWRRNNLDGFLFPTKGNMQTLRLKSTIPGSKLKYYQVSYDLEYFKPLTDYLGEGYIFNLSSYLAYANKYGGTFRYPFFKNYFTGGADSIRGYRERSLGPKDSQGNNFGGNALVNVTTNLIVPVPFKPDLESVRLALFLDAGQVYDTEHKVRSGGSKRNPGGMRYAGGISAVWNTPLGMPMKFSFARRLKKKPGDDPKFFAFTFGTQFF